MSKTPSIPPVPGTLSVNPDSALNTTRSISSWPPKNLELSSNIPMPPEQLIAGMSEDTRRKIRTISGNMCNASGQYHKSPEIITTLARLHQSNGIARAEYFGERYIGIIDATKKSKP